MDKEIKEELIKTIVEKGIHVLGKDGDYIIGVNEDEARKIFTLAEINIKKVNEEDKDRRKERCKKLEYEISVWIDSGPNKTLSRLRKFYDSIMSINVGGEGIMGKHRLLRDSGASLQELKKSWRNYKYNYPIKDQEI